MLPSFLYNVPALRALCIQSLDLNDAAEFGEESVRDAFCKLAAFPLQMTKGGRPLSVYGNGGWGEVFTILRVLLTTPLHDVLSKVTDVALYEWNLRAPGCMRAFADIFQNVQTISDSAFSTNQTRSFLTQCCI